MSHTGQTALTQIALERRKTVPKYECIDDYIDDTFHWNDNGIIKSTKGVGIVLIELVEKMEKVIELLEENNKKLDKIIEKDD